MRGGRDYTGGEESLVCLRGHCQESSLASRPRCDEHDNFDTHKLVDDIYEHHHRQAAHGCAGCRGKNHDVC